METERTYETYLTFSPLYGITGNVWRKPILCVNVHTMEYREKRGAKLCRKTNTLEQNRHRRTWMQWQWL